MKTPNLQFFQNLVAAYDRLFAENAVKPDDLTDEQIDEILSVQDNLDVSLDALIVAQKVYATRKLIAEKNSDLCKTMIYRIMRRLDIREYEGEDGKCKFVPGYKCAFDPEKLPEEYKMPCHAKITSQLAKGEKVEGVTVLDSYAYVRIS